MDALLSSIGQSVRAESNSNGNVCNTIQDVCQSLANHVARRTDTRAEHISTAFEIRQNAVFDIAVEPEVPEGEDPVHHLQPPVTRTINASETIMNQPNDDPVLQRIVAKHIIGAIGEVDGSSWNVRQVVRGVQGWDFTYQCKNSLQAWNRQNAKSTGRPPIAAWSGPGGQDPINMSRPAFDCRGSCLPPVANGNHVGNKSTKAKRPPPAEGEEGAPKKRAKRKSKAADNTEPNQADPEGTNTSAQNPSIPEQNSANAGAASATPFLNIPAAEAARRRELAVELLSGKGIDPTTLSEEQMNIFSNQAPHLQELSLEMLAKYGAERLRIVHPDEKDQQASANTTPAQGTPDVADASAPGPAAAPPGDTETPTKKRKPRKRKSDAAAENGDGTAASRAVEPGNAQNGGMETTTMTLNLPKQRRTRGTCDTCKNRKVKCTKEHPVCSVCQEAGETCVYLPPRPRRKSEKPAEKSAEAADPDTDVQAEEEDDAGEREQIEQPEHIEPPQNVQPTPVPPPQVPTSFSAAANAYGHASAPTTAPGYDTYGRYSTSNTQYPTTTTAGDATAHSSYEPNSYQTQSTSTATNSYTAPSYDYSRSSGTADTNTANDTSNYGASSSGNSNQWTSAQGRGSRSDTTHSYNMPNAQPAPTSPYGTRSAARQASQAAYNQSQQPGYNSYQSQIANQPHQSQSNQTWYGFPAASTSTSNHANYNSNTANATYGSTSASANAGAYSSHRPSMPGYGSSYGEEPSMFDLLSRGHPGN
ncbi:hypothetical protein PG985_004309 [Apiospora marii]|uniref:uncharacterized protein n=1 Tax=Apiospora marii TaxID=335849 RepID=UPI00312FB2D9